MRKWIIDPETRAAVYKRSGWVCELCKSEPAVHMHHLTYERAGRELTDDLRHICLLCHMKEHPEKSSAIARFELSRGGRYAEVANGQLEWLRELEEEDYREAQRQREYEKYVQQKMAELQAEHDAARRAEWGLYGFDTENAETYPIKQTLMCSIRDLIENKTIDAIPSEMTYVQMAAERDRQKSALFAKFGEPKSA